MKLVFPFLLLLLFSCSSPEKSRQNSDTLKTTSPSATKDTLKVAGKGVSLQRDIKYYNGLIGGKYSIEVTLTESEDSVSGQYRYTSQTSYLTLKGTVKNGRYELKEFDPSGKNTGSFSGSKNANEEIAGKWTNPKRNLDFVFSPKKSDQFEGAVLVGTKEFEAKDNGCVCASLLVPYVLKASSPSVQENLNKHLGVNSFTYGDNLEDICSCSDFGTANGITSGYFDVLYNKGNVLSIQWCGETMGAYPSGYCLYKNLDLRTGNKISDLKEVYQEEGVNYILDKVNKVLNQRVDALKKDSESDEDLKEFLSDEIIKREFNAEDIKEFSFGEKGITIRYSFGFPHYALCYEPSGDVEISYQELEKWEMNGGVLSVE